MTRPDLEAPRVALAVDAILDPPPRPVPTTPSVQSRALAQLMMNGVRPIGDRLRITRNPALQMVREAFDAVGLTPAARGTRGRPVNEDPPAGSVRGVWVTGRGADPSAGVLLHLHGGGFVFGSHKTHPHFVAA